jgi:hypothetical protein
MDEFRKLPDEIQAIRLHAALDALVALSSHYALLLNVHDGGDRQPVADADAWILRLYEIGELPRRDEVGS